MPQLALSSFSRWSLTDEETLSGQQFTDAQLMVLQNLLCDFAEEKVSLKFDSSNPLAFAQREAELQGQIGLLRMLIDTSSLATRSISTP